MGVKNSHAESGQTKKGSPKNKGFAGRQNKNIIKDYSGLQLRRLQPLEFKGSPVYFRRIRYRVTADINQQSFSNNDLCRGLGGIVAVSAVLAYPVCGACRLRMIEMWAPITTLGTNITASVQWDTSGANQEFSGPDSIESDSSMDPSRPAYIKTRPSRNTANNCWKSCEANNTNRMCLISCPTGTIIDFEFQWTINEALGVNASTVVAGAAIGGWYHRQILTGNASVVSLNSIA